jgi:hypothetical protein
MTITINDNYVSDGLNRLLYQFQGKPRLEALVTAILEQVQDCEDVVEQLLSDRQIDTATGATLDVIGKIVGQDRQGRDDPTYRIWIRARIIINRATGVTEDFYAILAAICSNPTVGDFRVIDEYLAGFRIFSGAATDVPVATMLAIINLIRGAGISMNLVYTGADPVFKLDIGAGLDVGHLATLY